VRQRAERAMGRGVAVAADDGGAGQGKTLLGADHVHDALRRSNSLKYFDAEFACFSAITRICSMLSGIGIGF